MAPRLAVDEREALEAMDSAGFGMPPAGELLEGLRAEGVHVWRDGGRLRFRAPEGLRDRARDQLVCCRYGVLRAMGASDGEIAQAEVLEVVRELPLEFSAAITLAMDGLGCVPTEIKLTTGERYRWS